MIMSKLYEITDELSRIESLIEENNGEVDTEVLSLLNNLNIKLQDKIVNITRILKNNDADIEALRNEEKRLAKKRKTLENKNSWLKEYIKANMEHLGIDKVKDKIFSISLRNTQPKLVVYDIEAVMANDRFIRIKKEVDKGSIRAAIKSGEEVKGAKLEHNKALYII
jgi:phage host-nuclease inhibitor protein Gam